MGMDQQMVGNIKQGIDMVEDVMGRFNRPDNNSASRYSAEAEANAGLRETQARAKARDIQHDALSDARNLREAREQNRSRRNAGWGQSGLAMSGSKALVRDGNRFKDRQDEADVLFEGDQAAQDALQSGRQAGNMFRINGGGTPRRTTLALGSKIYKQGR